MNFVQLQRASLVSLAECEAVGRLSAPPGEPLRFLNPEGLPTSPNYSQVALVAAPRLVLTGTQLAFGQREEDVRLAFQRMDKTLDSFRARFSGVAMSRIYPLSAAVAEKIRAARFDFFNKASPPASTMLTFEDLPSLDASFAIDVTAVAER